MALANPSPEPKLDDDAPALDAAPQPGLGPELGVLSVPAPDAAKRRGPFRPAVLSPVRERLTGPMLAQGFRTTDAALLLALLIGFGSTQVAAAAPASVLPAILLLALGSTLIAFSLSIAATYAFPAREAWGASVTRTVLAAGVPAAIVLLGLMLCAPGAVEAGAHWALGCIAAMGVSHLIAWNLVRRWRKVGRLTPNVVVVGATDNAARLIRTALQGRDVAVLGVFDDRSQRIPKDICGVPVLGDTSALLAHKILPYVDRIVLTVPEAGQARTAELIGRLKGLPNDLCLFLDGEGDERHTAALARLAGAALHRISGAKADERLAFAKRVQDLVIASLALVVALPIMAVVALLVRLDSPGPVLFRQRRHGFNNEEIVVWKFRSMRADAADATAARQVTGDDDRVTRIGRFIRKTSLDELPQLLNVLKGEMSLVGPRPHAIGMKTAGKESARLVAEYAWRHRMKPGITGWAQINGSRGPVHTAHEVRRRVELDIEYIERQSFWFDLYIIAMTLPCLLGDRQAVR
jgi:Undecaprenyl-phosphate glucose phosphotransferase